jgi:hypothetical protein
MLIEGKSGIGISRQASKLWNDPLYACEIFELCERKIRAEFFI